MDGWIGGVAAMLGFVVLPIGAAILCGKLVRERLAGRARLHILIVAICVAVLAVLVAFIWNMTSMTRGWTSFGIEPGLAGDLVVIGMMTFGALILAMTFGTLKAPLLGRCVLTSIFWLTGVFFYLLLGIAGHL